MQVFKPKIQKSMPPIMEQLNLRTAEDARLNRVQES